MKKVILALKKDRHVYLFVVLGLIMILFPAQVGGAAPYILGIGSLVYGILSVIICLRYPDSVLSLGSGVVWIVIGTVLLFQRGESIAILGVIWAMASLYEVAREIDDYRETKKISALSILSILASIVLAVILMVDPFHHFNTHVRILGLQIISAAFVRRKKKAASEKR